MQDEPDLEPDPQATYRVDARSGRRELYSRRGVLAGEGPQISGRRAESRSEDNYR